MKIILVRHTKTKKIKNGQTDIDRKLSKKGKLQLQYMNYVFKYFGLEGKIFCSPSKRTHQTLKGILKNNNLLKNPSFDQRLYSGNLQDFVDGEDFILISHEPKISKFLKTFGLNIKINTGSISILEIEQGKLLKFSYFTPKLK